MSHEQISSHLRLVHMIYQHFSHDKDVKENQGNMSATIGVNQSYLQARVRDSSSESPQILKTARIMQR